MVRKFILDTDWFTDCDDCVALRFLIRSLDEEHHLLGVNVNATTEYSYASLKAFMDYEGVSYPIGLENPIHTPSAEGYDFAYQKDMAKGSAYTNADGEKSLDFYKRLLEENDEVEIISIGFLTSISRVFQAYPHLAKKVKRLWIMGGKWDEQGGLEYNFCGNGNRDVIQASRFVVNELDVEKVFLGFEMGVDVFTGRRLLEEDILGRALNAYGCTHGRESWDPMLVLAAFYDKYEDAYDYEVGKASLGRRGESYFQIDKNGRDRYALKRKNNAYYEQTIDEIIKE
jgi:hypothetical protein